MSLLTPIANVNSFMEFCTTTKQQRSETAKVVLSEAIRSWRIVISSRLFPAFTIFLPSPPTYPKQQHGRVCVFEKKEG